MVSLGTQPANRKSGFGHSSPTGARAQDLSRQPARPDLWGARVSNDPGLPDQSPVSWVIIDTLPVMAVGDVVTLAPLATGVMLVIGENMTPKCQVQRTLEELNSVPCSVIGGVLNHFDRDRDKYYNKSYYEHTA